MHETYGYSHQNLSNTPYRFVWYVPFAGGEAHSDGRCQTRCYHRIFGYVYLFCKSPYAGGEAHSDKDYTMLHMNRKLATIC